MTLIPLPFTHAHAQACVPFTFGKLQVRFRMNLLLHFLELIIQIHSKHWCIHLIFIVFHVLQIATTKESYRKTWNAKYTLRSHFDGVRALAFHPVEPVLITASEDHTLKLWNLQKTVPAKKWVPDVRHLTCIELYIYIYILASQSIYMTSGLLCVANLWSSSLILRPWANHSSQNILYMMLRKLPLLVN